MTTCTSNDLTQLPGSLDIQMITDNDFVFSIDWSIDITGYTFSGYIIPENEDIEIPLDIAIVSASSGTMNVTISASSIDDLPESVNDWYLNWVDTDGYTRTVLAGTLVLRDKRN